MKTLGLLALSTALAAVGCVSVVPDPPNEENHRLRFVAQSGVATAKGRFARWRVVDANVDEARLDESFVEIEIDVTSIESGISGRDDHLRDPDFFEVERWPTAHVRVHGVRPSGEPERYDAKFEVRIRDERHTLDGSFDVVSRHPLVVAGEITIDRVRFGVGEAPSAWNPLDVNTDVVVSFRAALE